MVISTKLIFIHYDEMLKTEKNNLVNHDPSGMHLIH